jgi:Cu/Ag efflux protein CusF
MRTSLARVAALAALAAFVAPVALAQSSHSHSAPPAATAKPAALAEGEVRRVDKAAKRITIKHGPIPSIDMAPMTMVFQVKDPKMLDQVKAGDRIRFDAAKVGDSYVVTMIEK